MSAKRFLYVGTGRTDIVHRSYGRMDGDRTFCGVTVLKGWRWWVGLRYVPRNSAICARCEATRK